MSTPLKEMRCLNNERSSSSTDCGSPQSSWRPWQDRFEAAGYATVAPTWPGEAELIDVARAAPERQAGYGVKAVTDHFVSAIAGIDPKPIVIGHSFGGLVAQQLLARGVVDAAVAISPAQMRGILILPPAQLKTAFPVLSKPKNKSKAVALTADQFAKGFGNALERAESDALWAQWNIPSPARPLFQGPRPTSTRRPRLPSTRRPSAARC